MSGRLSSIWGKVNSSFWFIPALVTAGSLALHVLTLWLDFAFTDLAGRSVFYSGGASAARDLLAAISGSLIAVIATAFSLTIVTFTLASGQYTPRLLRSLSADRGLQVVLGSYIGTFVYALMILRVVRSPDSEGESFVPVVSVSVAVFMTLVCVGLLIYFIYHVINLIQPSTIVQRLQAETMTSIVRLEDADGSLERANGPEDDPELKSLLAEAPLEILSRKSGYVQFLDADAVVKTVTSTGKPEFIEMPFGPGHFVAAGLPVVRIWPARADVELDSETEDKVRQALVFGEERAFRQDFTFGLRQLTDIALKGLSPSTNDPTTAMQALDRTEAILVALGGKALPRRVRRWEMNEAATTVKVAYPGFDDIVELAFDQATGAAFATAQTIFLRRLLEVAERAIWANPSPERLRPLWDRAFTVARLAPGELPNPMDAAMLMLRTVEIGRGILEKDRSSKITSNLEEISTLSEGLRGGERVREAVSAARRDG
jgi:uncharacterized membrane protein